MTTETGAAPRKKPAHKFQLGSMHFAVWANEGHDGNGEVKTFYNVTHERNYEVEKGSDCSVSEPSGRMI